MDLEPGIKKPLDLSGEILRTNSSNKKEEIGGRAVTKEQEQEAFNRWEKLAVSSNHCDGEECL